MIKLYISTYNNEKRISQTLKSLLSSRDLDKVKVTVINNHSNFIFSKEFLRKKSISILHNDLRPDFSSGHLSRTWNQCIVNGFKSLSNPDCDYVVTAQDDTIFDEQWVSKLIRLHEKYEFIQNGHGDHLCSYKPEHIKKVGLWDERFCGITRQAADYFVRCVMYNKEGSSINDPKHYRVLNPIFSDPFESQNYLVESDSRKFFGDETYPNSTHNTDTISKELIQMKYGFDPFPWSPENLSKLPEHTLCENFIMYPYFECEVENLKEKKYIT